MNKKISPNFYASDWPDDLSDRNSNNWGKAIEIIRDRFDGRYFKPMEVLIKHEDKPLRMNVGFIVMSIDCLLIETLNQFYFGLINTDDKYKKNNTNPDFKYNWQAFRDYFRHSKKFTVFHGDDDLCKEFFNQIRCGLLHQAESKFNSLINLKEKEVVNKIDNTDVKKGLIINRNIFHEYVREDFEQYYNDLKNPDCKNKCTEYLRDNCNKKMIKICS